VVLALLVAGMALILFNETLFSLGCRLFSPFPKIKSGLMNMHYNIALLKSKRAAIYLAVGISSLMQIILAFSFYLVARALHQPIGFIYFIIFVPIICVAASLPSIGGLGVRDAGSVYLFSKIGVDAATAVSLSLINFLFMVIVGLIGGVVYVAARKPRWQPVSSLPTEATTSHS
jgi:uncharacterized membrane protein YbhN (UPF0104 family)